MNDDKYGHELSELISSLTVIAKRNNVLSLDLEAVRGIGEQANGLGGVQAMQKVEGAIRDLYSRGEFGGPGDDNFHPAEIDAAWDGIGKWRW